MKDPTPRLRRILEHATGIAVECLQELLGVNRPEDAVSKVAALYATGFSDAMAFLRRHPEEAAILAQEYDEFESGQHAEYEDWLETLMPKVH